MSRLFIRPYAGCTWYRWGIQFFIEIFDGVEVYFCIGPVYFGIDIWRKL